MAHVHGAAAAAKTGKSAAKAAGQGMEGMAMKGMEGMAMGKGMESMAGMEGMMTMGKGMEGMAAGKGMAGMMGGAAATGAAAGTKAGKSFLGKVFSHPLVLFGLGVAVGYAIHKYRKEIIESATRASEKSKDFVLQQRENLEDLVAETRETDS